MVFTISQEKRTNHTNEQHIRLPVCSQESASAFGMAARFPENIDICPNCHGEGSWKTDYVPEYEHWEGKMGGYWNYKTCDRCKGKGYLEKKVTWE